MDTITIKKRLDSDVIKLGSRVKSLLGKKVEITIGKIREPKPKERKWTTLGSVSIGKITDNINIRDLAYDD